MTSIPASLADERVTKGEASTDCWACWAMRAARSQCAARSARLGASESRASPRPQCRVSGWCVPALLRRQAFEAGAGSARRVPDGLAAAAAAPGAGSAAGGLQKLSGPRQQVTRRSEPPKNVDGAHLLPDDLLSRSTVISPGFKPSLARGGSRSVKGWVATPSAYRAHSEAFSDSRTKRSKQHQPDPTGPSSVARWHRRPQFFWAINAVRQISQSSRRKMRYLIAS